MIKIKLSKGEWNYDDSRPLGNAGGFGQVFEGTDLKGSPVAVKRLHIDQAQTGNRELRIALELAGHNFANVIPILDSGVDKATGRYFIVMARADHSLANFINSHGPVNEAEAIVILNQIARGLEEIKDLIHRDLKPDNVLYHNGNWKIADLGIARFIEDSTSINTLKDCLTPAYAAPEQWKGQTTTKKTDIYAFGCIIYTLITGAPPFGIHSYDELRQRHISDPPPTLAISAHLSQLAFLCLMKSAESRPDIASVMIQLEQASAILNKERLDELASAAANIAKQEAIKEAIETHIRRYKEDRQVLFNDACASLKVILDNFQEVITRNAPVANVIRFGNGRLRIQLGGGVIEFNLCFREVHPDHFPRSRWDVICGVILTLTQKSRSYKGRSANLWFMKPQNDLSYRWWEVSYMFHPLSQHGVEELQPFGIVDSDQLKDIDYAASSGMHLLQFGSPLTPIDAENREAFIQRWAKRLALSSDGSLKHPSRLPETEV